MSTITRGLTDIQGVNISAPTENAFTASGFESFASDAAYEVAHPSPDTGEAYFNTTDGAFRIYNGTAWQYDRTRFSAQTDSTSTGANQDIAPNTFDQLIRFTGGSLTSIRSINPANQRIIYLFNGQASNGITLVNESAGATAANRILTGRNADFVIQNNSIVKLVYDEDASRWRLTERQITGIESYASDAEYTTAHNPPVAGARYWNTTSLVVREYNGGAWQNNKVLFSTENNTALTGADQNVTPVTDQIIKLSNASLTSVAGVNPSVHKFLILINGTGASLSIKNESSAATSALYRILTGTGVDLSMRDGASILLAYDDNSSRWRVTGGSGSGGSSASPLNCCLVPNDVSVQWTQALGYGWYSSAATAASTTTTTAECPLSPVVTTAIKMTRTTVGSYDAYRWRMPAGLKGQVFPISWLQAVQSGAVSGEFKVDVYTYTDAAYTTGAARKALRSDSSSVTSIPAYTGFFGSGNIIAFDAGTEDYYEVRFPRVSGTNWLSIVNLYLGPQPNSVANAMGEYENTSSYTIGATTTPPTPGTGAVYNRNTYRVGRWAIIRYEYKHSVAGSAGTGDYLLPLPSGLSIDYSRAGTTGTGNHCVGGGQLTTSVTFDAKGEIANSGSYANKIFVTFQNETTGETGWGSGGSTLANTNVSLSITVRVPIVGWDDTVIVGPGNTQEYLSSSFSSYSPVRLASGTALPTTTPAGSIETLDMGSSPWIYPQQIGDFVRLEIQLAGGSAPWTPIDGANIDRLYYNGTNYVGLGMYWDSGASVWRLARGKYAQNPTTAWSSIPAGTRFRIVKANPTIPAGLEHGQFHGGAQLYKAGYAPGLRTGVDIGTGYIGQVISSGLSGVSSPATGIRGDIATLTLEAGVWDITANVMMNRNGSTFASFYWQLSVITASGNSSTGESVTSNLFYHDQNMPLTFTAVPLMAGPVRVLCDGTNITVAGLTTAGTTIRLKSYVASYSAATPIFSGLFRAVRVG